MRFLLSTVAATALMASPALAQTIDNDVTEAPGAAEPMDGMNGIDSAQLEQDLTGAGFTDAQELDRAEVYFSTYQGQQALVIIMDEDVGVAMDDPIDDPDATATLPGDDPMDDDFAADPALEDEDDFAAAPGDPAIGEPGDPAVGEDDLAEAPGDPAIPEDDDLAADPAFPEEDDDLAADPAFPEEEDDFAADPGLDDPDATATVPGIGVEDDLSQAGFDMPERTGDGQVFQTTTEDGRTMYIVLASDFGAPGLDAADPAQPDMAPEPEADPAEPELDQID